MKTSRIELRVGALDGLAAQLPATRLLVVADAHTERWIPAQLKDQARHVLPPGEGSKSWERLQALLQALDAAGLDRDGHLLAVGGGVVTDLAGLAASLHRRGIGWSAAPTSLVGQVDAAIGGKTAVNLTRLKNAVGSFHAPDRVVIDPRALSTLPRRQLRSGLAEVAKTALVDGEELLARVEQLDPDAFAAASAPAVEVLGACVAVKQGLVGADPYDRGQRRLLNLGHSFGHALEALDLGGRLHGEAVGLGLLCAARLAGGLPDGDATLEARLRRLLERWGLPTRVQAPAEQLLGLMQRDKKRRAGALQLVLPLAPGRVVVRPSPGQEALLQALGAVLGPASTS